MGTPNKIKELPKSKLVRFLICIAMKLDPRTHLPCPNWEAASRIAGSDSRRDGIVFAAKLTLYLLWSVSSLLAQAPPLTPVLEPASLQVAKPQAARPRRTAAGKESVTKAVPFPVARSNRCSPSRFFTGSPRSAARASAM